MVVPDHASEAPHANLFEEDNDKVERKEHGKKRREHARSGPHDHAELIQFHQKCANNRQSNEKQGRHEVHDENLLIELSQIVREVHESADHERNLQECLPNVHLLELDDRFGPIVD